jgi:hypothetical protein
MACKNFISKRAFVREYHVLQKQLIYSFEEFGVDLSSNPYWHFCSLPYCGATLEFSPSSKLFWLMLWLKQDFGSIFFTSSFLVIFTHIIIRMEIFKSLEFSKNYNFSKNKIMHRAAMEAIGLSFA